MPSRRGLRHQKEELAATLAFFRADDALEGSRTAALDAELADVRQRLATASRRLEESRATLELLRGEGVGEERVAALKATIAAIVQ